MIEKHLLGKTPLGGHAESEKIAWREMFKH